MTNFSRIVEMLENPGFDLYPSQGDDNDEDDELESKKENFLLMVEFGGGAEEMKNELKVERNGSENMSEVIISSLSSILSTISQDHSFDNDFIVNCLNSIEFDVSTPSTFSSILSSCIHSLTTSTTIQTDNLKMKGSQQLSDHFLEILIPRIQVGNFFPILPPQIRNEQQFQQDPTNNISNLLKQYTSQPFSNPSTIILGSETPFKGSVHTCCHEILGMIQELKSHEIFSSLDDVRLIELLQAFNWDKEDLEHEVLYHNSFTLDSLCLMFGIPPSSLPSFEFDEDETHCPICYSESSESIIKLSLCDHKACPDCWRNHLLARIDSHKEGVGVKCLGCGDGCASIVPASIAVHLSKSDPQLLEVWLYQTILQFSTAKRSSSVSTLSKSSRYALCQLNSTSPPSCPNCIFFPHPGVSCEMLAEWINKDGFYPTGSDESQESIKAKLKITKPCPMCGLRVEKAEGCPHMICGSNGPGGLKVPGGCGYDFCWDCGGPHHTSAKCSKPKVIPNFGSWLYFEEWNQKCVEQGIKIEFLLGSRDSIVEEIHQRYVQPPSNLKSKRCFQDPTTVWNLQDNLLPPLIRRKMVDIELIGRLVLCTSAIFLADYPSDVLSVQWSSLLSLVTKLGELECDLVHSSRSDFFQHKNQVTCYIEATKGQTLKMVQLLDLYIPSNQHQSSSGGTSSTTVPFSIFPVVELTPSHLSEERSMIKQQQEEEQESSQQHHLINNHPPITTTSSSSSSKKMTIMFEENEKENQEEEEEKFM